MPCWKSISVRRSSITCAVERSIHRQADIDLGEGGGGGVRADDGVELRETHVPLEAAICRVLVQHRRHEPGKALAFPNSRQDIGAVAVERGAVAFLVPGIERARE